MQGTRPPGRTIGARLRGLLWRLFRIGPRAYRHLFSTLDDAVFVLDAGGVVVDANAAGGAAPGVGGATGRHWQELFARDSAVGRWLSAGVEGTVELDTEDGRHLEASLSALPGQRGVRHAKVLRLRDATVRRQADVALRQSEAMLRRVAASSPSGILRLRPVRAAGGVVTDYVCELANEAAAACLGGEVDSLTGSPVAARLSDQGPRLLEAWRAVVDRQTPVEVDVRMPVGGVARWFRVAAAPLGTDLSITFVDVTTRKRREHEVERAALLDPLTRLLNRQGFDVRAAQRIEMTRGGAVALLFLDLDRFGQVNDAQGREAGDVVRREVARRLRACVRDTDPVARIGADEFVVLMPSADREAVGRVAVRIQAAMQQPVAAPAGEVVCLPSIGVAMSSGRTRLADLLGSAERAMSEARTRHSIVFVP